MKFKFTPFIILLSFLFINSVSAQKMYIKPSFGYGFGAQKTYTSIYNRNTQVDSDTIIYKGNYDLKKLSFGKGINFELAVGTAVSDKLSLELVGFFHKSDEEEIKSSDNYKIVGAFDIRIYDTKYLRGYMYGVKPNIVYNFGKKRRPYYIKAGGLIGLASIKEEGESNLYNTIPGYFPAEHVNYTAKYNNRLSLGFNMAFGHEIYMYDYVYFFWEINYSNSRYVPLSRELQEYRYEGDNQIDQLTESEIHTEFVDSYSESENQNDNVASKRLKSAYSFGQVGILFGLKIDLFSYND